MTTKPFDILVAGEINPDLILSGDVVPEFGQVEKLVDSVSLAIGSSSAIFACGAARLGLKVAFAGVCGSDQFGYFMLEEMVRHRVDISGVTVDQELITGFSLILVKEGDRAILTYPGSISALRAEDVKDSLLRQASHLHVASYYLQTGLQPGLPDLFNRAHSLGMTISLDPNWDPSNQWRDLMGLLPQVDVLLLNENEALALSGAGGCQAALEQLSHKCPVVAIKLGAEGAIASWDGTISRAPAVPVKVVDTVGAGDSFDAGFLFGYLNNWGLERSLRLAVSCGSLSTLAAGGTAAQPTLEKAIQNVTSPR